MKRVSLTPDEASWYSRNVMKTTQLLEAAAKKDPKILERSTYKTLASLVPSVVTAAALADTEPKVEKVDLMLSRKQKLMVRDLILSVNKTLRERVIPEYETRGDEYKKHLDNAREKAQALEKMARKFK